MDNVRYLISKTGHVITRITALEPIIENWFNEHAITPNSNLRTPFKFASPSQNQSVTAPILMEVSTDDANTSMSKVEFFSGSTKIGEDKSYPFSFIWANPGVGEKRITAVLTDPAFHENGMVAYTRELTITVEDR